MNEPTKLESLAWEFVLEWNRKHPADPRFVDVKSGDLIVKKPPCYRLPEGLIVHIGHGPGACCESLL